MSAVLWGGKATALVCMCVGWPPLILSLSITNTFAPVLCGVRYLDEHKAVT